MQDELRAMGRTPILPPRAEVSRLQALTDLWRDAGLTDVATREITVARTFKDFEDYWVTVQIAGSMAQALRELSAAETANLMDRLRARTAADASDRITFTSRANAICGHVPT